MSQVRIQTSSNVDIEYELATVWDRIIATVVDHIVILSYILLLTILAAFMAPTLSQLIGSSTLGIGVTIIFMLPVIFYDLILEIYLNGQSFGKRWRKIRVVKIDGSQPSVGSYFIRWIFRIIDTWTTSGGVALVTLLITGKGQRLGDIAAETTVVKLVPAVTLLDTIYMYVEEGYEPVFKEVEKLDVKTVAVVREVLTKASSRKLMAPEIAGDILTRTREKLEAVMGVSSAMAPSDFLTTVIKDYNALMHRESDGSRL